MGFLPEAFVNMLAMLGWNDGTEEEIFDLQSLCERFSIDRIHKGGAKFDFEKAKWFNAEWIKNSSTEYLLPMVKKVLKENNIDAADQKIATLIPMVKERCHLLTDFYHHTVYFFNDPEKIDTDAILPKWDEAKTIFFNDWQKEIVEITDWTAESLEASFKKATTEKQIKPGELQLPMRIMLVGGKFGPPVFEIAMLIGKEATIRRIQSGLSFIKNISK